jgi:hypothetical protein
VELDQELETYRRELPRLLGEGHEGDHALVYRDRVDSLWPTHKAGCARLLVTDNTTSGTTILAGTGFDWFWESFASTNRKVGDLLN